MANDQILFNVTKMTEAKNRLEEIKSALGPKFRTDAEIIQNLIGNIQGDTLTPKLQSYMTATEEKSQNIDVLLETVYNFLTTQIPEYIKANDVALESLQSINEMIGNI